MNEHYIYGLHAVEALLTNPNRNVFKVFVNQERMDKRLTALIIKAEKKGIPIERLTSQQMNQQFAHYTHQGIVVQASSLQEYNESHLHHLLKIAKNPVLILILDGITDPHNLGACLRCADAAGVDFIIIPKDKSATITPVVSKVACGAAEFVPLVRVTNLVRTITLLKEQGVWIYGAAGETNSTLYQMDCTPKLAFVMGAEGKGLRRLTRQHCDALFSLPMLGTVDSLNVSVATGICLYEALRQRVPPTGFLVNNDH